MIQRKKSLSVLMLCFFLLASGIAQGQSVYYYVDPINGSDTNNGLSLETSFKSIFKARNAVRSRTSSMNGDIVVNLRGGIHQLDSTFTLSMMDGGNNGFNVIYQAYNCEKPILSGGIKVTGWTLFDVSRNIYQASVNPPTDSRQLYVNGKRATRARTTDAYGWEEEGDGYECPTEVANWKNISDVEVVSRIVWKCHRGPIASVSNGHATMAQPYWDNLHVQFSAPPSWIENAYELLDNEGEWYLDKSTSILYYKPKENEDISTAEIILSKLEVLVCGYSVNNMEFKGLTFAHATWLRPCSLKGFACIQADAITTDPISPNGSYFWQVFDQIPGNISFDHSSNIKINLCSFEHPGSTALQFYKGSRSDTIDNNSFIDISGSAISIGSLNDSLPLPDDVVKDNIITNNLISRAAVEFNGSIGILVGYTDHTVVSHNEIRNLPYSGISLGWGWSNTETIAKNNEVSYNLIDSVMTDLEDGGAIYTISAQRNSEVHHNFIKNVLNQPGALYADQGTSYMRWHHNVVDNAPRWVDLWSETSLNVIFDFNYYSNPENIFGGTNCIQENNVYVQNNKWPFVASQIMESAGRFPSEKCIADFPEITLYPNPVVGEVLSVTFDNLAQEIFTIKIFDLKGSLVQTATKDKPLTELNINVGGYARGLYVILFISNNSIYRKKFVKK